MTSSGAQNFSRPDNPATTITLFSPTGLSPTQVRATLVDLAREDQITFLDDIDAGFVATAANVTVTVEDYLINDALGWLDDVALAEGLGMLHGDQPLRFGDEDVDFTIKMRGDDDARIGVSRLGLEPLMKAMRDDEDFIVITRFDVEDPADESHFIQARSFTELDGWTMEYAEGGTEHKTIVADVDQAINTILRWMNHEDISDLDWTRS
ncbi:hypothetical protein [Corynebacterium gallinarum]|uniref:Uncharacterized protein n=1 Tax=Corynebacterium gallinarum TaxID=2762214 RepID=A0A8I0HNU7_9CORY|nr:hypothetical protein [Corynebacterium gallinarum]MBD8030219.1 hypothetical protein [Corynebacterium gallinarum]